MYKRQPFEIAREQKKDKEIAEKYDIRGLHLLAAEDNELNAEIIEMLLTDDGAKAVSYTHLTYGRM